MESKLIGTKKMPVDLTIDDCGSGWEKVKWPKNANTMMCRSKPNFLTRRIKGLIVGHTIDGWSIFDSGKKGWYLAHDDAPLSKMRERVLYFFWCENTETIPEYVARQLLDLIKEGE